MSFENPWNASGRGAVSAGAATPPGGSNGQIQYNNGGVFGGLTTPQAQNAVIPSILFASLPTAATAGAGAMYLVTDIGAGGTIFVSNGTIWRPIGGRAVLANVYANVALTGTTTETVLASYTLPANIMTPNGFLEIKTFYQVTSNSNSKSAFVRLGGTGITGNVLTGPNIINTITAQYLAVWRNKNSTGLQYSAPGQLITYGTNNTALMTSSIDTTQAVPLWFTAQLAITTDTLTLTSYTIELVIP